MIIVGVGGMFYFHWQLALVSCVSLPYIAWRSWAVHRVMRPLWVEIQASEARMTEVADEGLGGIRVVKAFSREAGGGGQVRARRRGAAQTSSSPRRR